MPWFIAGLYDDAIQLIKSSFIGNKRDRFLEKVVYSVARSCVRLQLSVSENDTIVTAKNLRRNNDKDLADMTMDVDDINMKPGHGTALSPRGLEHHGLTNKSSLAAVTPKAFPVNVWWKLKRYIEDEESSVNSTGFRLRVVALDAILTVDEDIQPPMWLLDPFLSHDGAFPEIMRAPEEENSSMSDFAGIIRVFMKHSRQEDAATIAIRYLSRILTVIPSLALPRPASICLPHALLRQLHNNLTRKSSAISRQLEQCMEEVERIVAQRTLDLESIYVSAAP